LQLTWGWQREHKIADYNVYNKYSFENSCPEKKISAINLEKADGKEFELDYIFNI